MRQKRIRTRRRRASLGALGRYALAVLLLAGGCGGGGGESAPPSPRIERATAERLAATSESIAELLDQGDVCTAAGRADELRAQVTEAINARAIPARFHEELSAKANELVNEVNCPPPPTVTDDEAEDDEEPGRGKKKGKDDEEELPPITIPPPTVPEDE